MESCNSTTIRLTSSRALLLGGITGLVLAVACTDSGDGGGGPDETPTGGAGQGASGGLSGTGGASGGATGGQGVTGGGPSATGGAPASGGAGTGGTAAGGAGGSSGGVPGTGGTGTGGATGSPGLVPGTQYYNCDPPSGTVPELQLTPYVTTGLDLPIYVTHAPNETDRMFVLEQAGKIKVVRAGTVQAEPFLDITSKVSIDPWEQGLLGLAFHPDYAENGLFYIHYNAQGVSGEPDQANIVAEYKVSADNPDVADPTSERIVLSVDTDRNGDFLGYHNGGSIFFGLHDELFIALGDGAGRAPGMAANTAQDVTSLRGTLSRIDPLLSGVEPYTIPAGNLAEEMPMANGQPVAPEIWDYGLRNPYRTNMDACTGDIYFGDVGHFDFEEVDVEPADSGHHNYGWPIYEGEECFGGGTACQAPDRYREPVISYSHDGGSGAVIGGAVYRGSAIPGLRGAYVYSDLYGGTRIFRYDGTTDTISGGLSVEEQTNAGQMQQTLVSIQNGGDGELYFVGRGGSTEPDGPEVGQSVIYKLEEYVP